MPSTIYTPATAGARIVTKQNTGGITYAAASLSVPAAGTSSWGQVLASTATEIAILEVGFYTTSTTTSSAAPAYIDVGIGSSGSESVLADVRIMCPGSTTAWTPSGAEILPAPLRIGSGQRVALRATQLASWGATFSLIAHITYIPWANLEGN